MASYEREGRGSVRGDRASKNRIENKQGCENPQSLFDQIREANQFLGMQRKIKLRRGPSRRAWEARRGEADQILGAQAASRRALEERGTEASPVTSPSPSLSAPGGCGGAGGEPLSLPTPGGARVRAAGAAEVKAPREVCARQIEIMGGKSLVPAVVC